MNARILYLSVSLLHLGVPDCRLLQQHGLAALPSKLVNGGLPQELSEILCVNRLTQASYFALGLITDLAHLKLRYFIPMSLQLEPLIETEYLLRLVGKQVGEAHQGQAVLRGDQDL